MNTKSLTRKKPLTPEQKADADRLLALWTAWQERTKAEGKKPLTQGEFGYRYEIGSQGMVWQYLHGATPLNLKAVMAFAVAMDCRVEDISPEAGKAVALVTPEAPKEHFPAIERMPGHPEVRERLREALPESLKQYVGWKSAPIDPEDTKFYRLDYLSPLTHAELVLMQRPQVSRAMGNAMLHLAVEDGPQDKYVVVVTEEEPKPLITVYRKACAKFNIKPLFAKTIPEAAALLVDLEHYEDDYEAEAAPEA
jgi:hypothetical protein